MTVTADRYVNKGPGRPVFPEQFRAEMLDIRKQLREVQLGLRRDVDRLEGILRFVNIGLVPIVVAVIALGVGGWRLARRRRRAA